MYAALVMKRQRSQLLELARLYHVPLLFLKAAWAEPVLYAGCALRQGNDIDVLVTPGDFPRWVAVMKHAGYRRVVPPRHPWTHHRASAWVLQPIDAGLPIDVHRSPVPGHWFDLDTALLMERARWYPSSDGSVPSLSPEDQVLFAAANSATEGFANQPRHVADVGRLHQRFPICWRTVGIRAQEANLEAALFWLGKALDSQGYPTPLLQMQLSPTAHAALVLAEHLGQGQPRHPTLWSTQQLLARTLVSRKPGALLSFLKHYITSRVLDHAVLSARALTRGIRSLQVQRGADG